MKKWLLRVMVILGLGVVQAQESYFGVGPTVGTTFNAGETFPVLGLHAGRPILDNLELRVQLDTLVFVSVLAADLLYSFDIDEATRVYVGGGPDLLVIAFMGIGATPGLHGTLGLEYAPGNIGYFTEVQPVAPLTEVGLTPPVLAKLRAGVNFYF